MSGIGDRLNQRKKDFKKGIDSEDARRKREDAAVQLRKQVREEALEKKRMTSDAPNVNANGMAMLGEGDTENQIIALASRVNSQNADEQFQAVQQLRKCLSVENSPPIQEVIQTGVVPRLVEMLKDISKPELQFEAEWVLTNIASGNADQTRVVVEAGALPLFIQLLQSPNPDVQEQAVWALGNIAGDSANLRDLVLFTGGLLPIMGLLQSNVDKPSMMRNATWTLSNLCRGKPPPPFEVVSPALNVLAGLLNQADEEVLTDACWAFSYLSDGPNERISGVIQAGVVPRLVQLLQHNSSLVQTPALRAVGNIVTGDDEQTQTVLRNNVTAVLLPLLSHEKKNIKKEACWTISNITAGNKEQIQEVINAGLIPAVIELLRTGDFDIKKEAAWVISNATAGGTPQQIEYLVTCDCLRPVIDLLSTSDVKIVTVALEALEHILQCGKNGQIEAGLAENPIVRLIEEADGITKIEALQEDPTEEIYAKAMRILETFFPLDDVDTIEADAFPTGGFGAAAQIPQGGFNFNFGGTQTPAFTFS
jgi:HEAT repeat protein|mmetsp:Transcript_24490/g.39229  ORF Transcript_24490/g.39229 Transcript_24490/m.39229 type:complete len:537 (-) Transcript_24490:211-1821(-)|eukprot:CAMPEP_0169086064 /NCGR_PEP_ID=MMETSP1015-20121227/13496_1 /TAXON_ID=342587 /ORGANISM="Karlodinium micrum, Strain CCMP2283" /LENGTH=536 /DNA_ID=CAMNT_0009146197 /DNA_START=47 /DNA_END=1660 /DNA_ORIENTATION=-